MFKQLLEQSNSIKFPFQARCWCCSNDDLRPFVGCYYHPGTAPTRCWCCANGDWRLSAVITALEPLNKLSSQNGNSPGRGGQMQQNGPILFRGSFRNFSSRIREGSVVWPRSCGIVASLFVLSFKRFRLDDKFSLSLSRRPSWGKFELLFGGMWPMVTNGIISYHRRYQKKFVCPRPRKEFILFICYIPTTL